MKNIKTILLSLFAVFLVFVGLVILAIGLGQIEVKEINSEKNSFVEESKELDLGIESYLTYLSEPISDTMEALYDASDLYDAVSKAPLYLGTESYYYERFLIEKTMEDALAKVESIKPPDGFEDFHSRAHNAISLYLEGFVTGTDGLEELNEEKINKGLSISEEAGEIIGDLEEEIIRIQNTTDL